MTAKTSDFRLPKAAALLENRLSHFRRLLHSEMFRFNPEARDLYPRDEWIYSTVDLARFINCSESTARRLKRDGSIPFVKHGNHVFYHLPAILNTVANDDRLAALFTRKSPPRRAKKAPLIYYHCFLKQGWMYIDIRYDGWKCTLVCSRLFWFDEPLKQAFIREVVSLRKTYKPFKTLTNEKN